jgi:diadenosine tetraphosphate (Ap4A) HIT family hydrolase
MTCVFCRIVAGELPGTFVYRDDRCAAFMDIKPVTPGHLLVVPLKHATHLADLESATAAHLMQVGQVLAAALRGSDLRCEGVNFFLADGAAAGQEVFHVHLHVFPRFQGDGFGLRFGPDYGERSRAELERSAGPIRQAVEPGFRQSPPRYLVVEHYRNGDPVPVYRRFRSQGRLMPQGLEFVSSWITEDLTRCYQVVESADRGALDEWMARWMDLVDFEVHPVLTSKQVQDRLGPLEPGEP